MPDRFLSAISSRAVSASLSPELLCLSEAAQQRGNRQALRKYGEGYDGKGKHNNHVVPWKVLRQGQGKRECQCTPQSTPEKDVLVSNTHLESAADKYRTQRVNGRRPSKRYQGDSKQHRYP